MTKFKVVQTLFGSCGVDYTKDLETALNEGYQIVSSTVVIGSSNYPSYIEYILKKEEDSK
jgi:hypothetical protein